MSAGRELPQAVGYDLDEALELLASLEDARGILLDSDRLAALAQIEHQIQLLSRRLGFGEGRYRWPLDCCGRARQHVN